MIIVHHLNNSRSQRVLWLLEELGLSYQVQRYARDRKTMLAPPELKAVHPLGKAPVIVDDAAEGGARIVAETGAIIEYLVDKAGGRLRPIDQPGHLHYRYFLHYAEGSVMPPLVLKLILGMVPLFGKAAQRRIQPMIDVHLDFIEQELATRRWFAGDAFSAADVMMSFPLEAARSRAGLDGSRPATIAWLQAIHARPAYQAALAAGGPYAYA
jgi:glutathione S-transferase